MKARELGASHNFSHRGMRLARLVGKSLVVLVMMIVSLYFVYLVKKAVGIDIFPDKHLSDFLPPFLVE